MMTMMTRNNVRMVSEAVEFIFIFSYLNVGLKVAAVNTFSAGPKVISGLVSHGSCMWIG